MSDSQNVKRPGRSSDDSDIDPAQPLIGPYDSTQLDAKPLRAAISPKVLRYSQRLIQKYDRNGNQSIDKAEWSIMRGKPAMIDSDKNGKISVQEMAQRVADYGLGRHIRLITPSPESLGFFPPLGLNISEKPAAERSTIGGLASENSQVAVDPQKLPNNKSSKNLNSRKFYVRPSRIPAGLPDWFLRLDLDGDSQVTLSEFSRELSMNDFSVHDRDGDGVITQRECLQRIKKENAKETASTGQDAAK